MGMDISESLIKLFSKKRIVFWHDKKNEMWEEFQNIDIKGIKKLEIKNNEFSLKYKILKEEPFQKFLIYKNQKIKDSNEQNWLLDVELYAEIFTTDKLKIWMSELELENYFIDTVREHRIFFNSEKRRKSLKLSLKKEDNLDIFKRKMLFSISETEEEIEGLIGKLFEEYFLQKEDKLKLIKKCNLEKYMWNLFNKEYNYNSENPNINDFALELFNSNFKYSINKKGSLNRKSTLLLQRWKNNRKNNEIFEGLSNQYQKVLKINETIENFNYRELLEFDFFQEIDRFIIKSLIYEIK